VRAGHGEDPGGLGHEGVGERLAAEAAEINAQLAQHIDGMRAGGLAPDGADPGAGDADIRAAAEHLAEEPLGHGAAAHVSGADE